MVAQAEPVLLDTTSLAIKVLDLLTNRYHVGIIRESGDGDFHVELPASAHFHAGQRVRFIVAGNHAVVRRNAMQRGFITQVSSPLADRLNVRLCRMPETAVA